MKKRVAFVFVVLVASAVFLTSCERAERPWPSRAIQVIIPFAPGGDSDFNARAYITRLGPILGQSVVAVNMPGAGGVVGATHVLNSAPDGYTVLMWHSNIIISDIAGTSTLNVDDFELAAIIGMSDFSVIVNTNSPFYTLNDLVNASIAAPDTILYAMATGTVAHIGGLLLNQAGAQFRLVDIGDTAERNVSLMGGHVHAIASGLGTVVPFFQSGDFRALAIINDRRNSVLTDIPTTVEQGFLDAAFPLYYNFSFPRGTPREIVERFTDALEQVYLMEDYRHSIHQTFMQEPFFRRGEEALNHLRVLRERVVPLAPYF